jgi:hypothetical protein
MREVVLGASWDVLFCAIPSLWILMWGFGRLDRLISSIRDEEKAADSRGTRPAWDVEQEGIPVEIGFK